MIFIVEYNTNHIHCQFLKEGMIMLAYGLCLEMDREYFLGRSIGAQEEDSAGSAVLKH
jgi:hypothetical protein